ncbi:MAG: hypothetical protein GXP31_11180 [Kiritimatiellaeota bacterium]|nr:hypothetical protein [Kiritimatiellota bacterium]
MSILPTLPVGTSLPGPTPGPSPRCISGRYPHLAVFNTGGECGIGAVAVWADRLWFITYPPHQPTGSDDKLYRIDPDLSLHACPESIGGTCANRMVHRESNQLFIGPYAIDADRRVRVIPFSRLFGRHTANARHLTDPAHKVYFFTMEEGLYEVDVHTLDVTTIHADTQNGGNRLLPGYHGKGAYSGQGRLVVSNNGERTRAPHETWPVLYGAAGCLAEWDGQDWHTLDRRQFCEVTGPGGIEGNPSSEDAIWATGWDKCSVLLRVLDRGRWQAFRLPFGSYCFVAQHGWFTEWPRIRDVGDGRVLMNMHGLWYDFPAAFRSGKTANLEPIASYLKITGDFCGWHGRIVFGCDDLSRTCEESPNLKLTNQSQSNLWFATWKGLHECGRPAGWGGPWLHDKVGADAPSEAFLVRGFDKRVLHLSHGAAYPVAFQLEIDESGDGRFHPYREIRVGPHAYAWFILPSNCPALWLRLRLDRTATDVCAYLHMGPGGGAATVPGMFASLASAERSDPRVVGIVRPRGADLGTLQFMAWRVEPDGHAQPVGYYEVDADMAIRPRPEAKGPRDFLLRAAGLGEPDFEVDAASVILLEHGRRWRLPKSSAAYDTPMAIGWPRGIREVTTERNLLNCHGTFYVLPWTSAGGAAGIKPICTHDRRISDFGSWRGMLVIAGARADARPDGHFFRSTDGKAGLWFGDVDDLWKMGKPMGHGGPWLDTPVQPDQPSDPYLMTGYDRKRLTLWHDEARPVRFTVEVDFIRDGSWCKYAAFDVAPDRRFVHEFPDGYSAHWIRLRADLACRASAVFEYR